MFVSQSLTTRKLLTYTINFNYKLTADKMGSLSLDADYSVYDRKPYETIHTDKYVLHPVIILQGAPKPSYIQNVFPTIYRIYTFAVNDDIKLPKNTSLLLAAKISFVDNDNTSDFGNVTSGVYKADPSFTGVYNYDEQINALGITYSAILSKKTNMQIGLRTEQTINRGESISYAGAQTKTDNNYVDFFPSLLLTSNLTDNDQLSLSFGRRIRRPMYTDLNPFLNYQDKYNYYIGNPDLKPQYTNTVELTNIYKQKLSITLYSSIITNYVFTTFLPGNVVAQKVNFGRNYGNGIQLNYPLTLTKWWTANLNVDASYQHYDNSLNGTYFNVNTQDISGNILQQFNFLKSYRAEVLAIYEAPRYEGFYHYDDRYKINAGISKSFFNKKGSIQFQVQDIFNSYFNTYNTNYQNLNYNNRAQNSFRTYQLNLSYSFGSKGTKAERAHKISSSEEQTRAGGGG